MKNYKILTSGNKNKYEEQEKILKYYNLNWQSKIKAHYFNSVFFDEGNIIDNIYNCIEGLAIKDGVDLVRFENGMLGFVAYYNNHKNGFEFIPQKEII